MLGITFGPLCISYPLVCHFTSAMNIWLKLLLIVVKFSGPTFVKLGQWASTRRDLFSSEFCDVLGLLHCNAACHPWSHSRHILSKAFGKHWETWCNIEFEHPVHSGCIGQVYRGWIDVNIFAQEIGTHFEKDLDNEESCNGKVQVAVKIIHPGVTELVDLDLTIMRGVANLISSLPGFKWLSLPEIVLEFEQLMKKQIDLRVEAKNLDSFNKFFADSLEVKFPSPIWPLVHPQVLIETWEAGIPISHFIGGNRGEMIPNKQKEKLARMGVAAILKMVFIDNFVHADLHPGNIIVQFIPEDHSSARTNADHLPASGMTRLVFLDAGIVASLKEDDLQNLHQVFTAIVLNKGDVVGELFLKHATCNECQTPEEFKIEMADLVNDVHQQTLKLGKIQVAGLLTNLFNLLIKHKVKLESNFSSVLLAIMILEGLGRSLDPQLDIMQQARPVLLSRLF